MLFFFFSTAFKIFPSISLRRWSTNTPLKLLLIASNNNFHVTSQDEFHYHLLAET